MGYRYYMNNRELWDSMFHNAAGVRRKNNLNILAFA